MCVCVCSTPLRSTHLGTWPAGMNQHLLPRFSGVLTDCYVAVRCYGMFQEGPETETRVFLKEADRLSYAVGTRLSRRQARCVPGGIGKWASPRDGKAITAVTGDSSLRAYPGIGSLLST